MTPIFHDIFISIIITLLSDIKYERHKTVFYSIILSRFHDSTHVKIALRDVNLIHIVVHMQILQMCNRHKFCLKTIIKKTDVG